MTDITDNDDNNENNEITKKGNALSLGVSFWYGGQTKSRPWTPGREVPEQGPGQTAGPEISLRGGYSDLGGRRLQCLYHYSLLVGQGKVAPG